MSPTNGPLTGLRVVEFIGIGPGPHVAMLLADLGAEVVRIERQGGAVALSFEDTSGVEYVIERSEDLAAWREVETLVGDGGEVVWLAGSAGKVGYFRVVRRGVP